MRYHGLYTAIAGATLLVIAGTTSARAHGNYAPQSGKSYINIGPLDFVETTPETAPVPAPVYASPHRRAYPCIYNGYEYTCYWQNGSEHVHVPSPQAPVAASATSTGRSRFAPLMVEMPIIGASAAAVAVSVNPQERDRAVRPRPGLGQKAAGTALGKTVRLMLKPVPYVGAVIGGYELWQLAQ